MGVLEFRVTTKIPLALRADGPGWAMKGRFTVAIRFDSGVGGCARFQYRQFIKGRATLQRGVFRTGVAPSRATWTPSGGLIDASGSFGVPGGLSSTHFSEDGSSEGGQVRRYGYRTADPFVREGEEDRYFPAQADGCEYRAMDTFGLSGVRRERGLRIAVALSYEGRVIDVTAPDPPLERRTWDFAADDIIASE